MKNFKKIYLHGADMKDVYPHATKWKVAFYKFAMALRKASIAVLTLTIVGSALFCAYAYGAMSSTEVVFADQKPVEIQVMKRTKVMDRIAKCESGGRHFDKKGAVVMRKNKNNSWDVGKYQINEATWGPTAAKLKMNIFEEKGNEDFAYWIYENMGTEPWYSSEACWNK